MSSQRLSPLPASFATTVAALHYVAEEVLAPACKPDNEIALYVTPGGFGTPVFAFGEVEHQVRVEQAELVHQVDGRARRAPLTSLEDARRHVADLLPNRALSTARPRQARREIHARHALASAVRDDVSLRTKKDRQQLTPSVHRTGELRLAAVSHRLRE